MSVAVNVGGSWKTATPWVNVGGVWKQAIAWVNVGGTWKQVSDGAGGSGELTPNMVQGTGRSKSAIYVSTNTPAVVNGAPDGATFTWNVSDTTWQVVSPGQPSTLFRKLLSPEQDSEATIYCTVTTGGTSHDTNTIDGYLSNNYIPPGGP